MMVHLFIFVNTCAASVRLYGKIGFLDVERLGGQSSSLRALKQYL
jgi:hypothetical protein